MLPGALTLLQRHPALSWGVDLQHLEGGCQGQAALLLFERITEIHVCTKIGVDAMATPFLAE